MGRTRSRTLGKNAYVIIGILILIALAGHLVPISSKHIGIGTDPCGTSSGEQTLRYQVLLGNIPIMHSQGNHSDYMNSILPTLNGTAICKLGLNGQDVIYTGRLYVW